METIYLHDSTINALRWMTNHIMKPMIHVTPDRDRGVVVFQTIDAVEEGIVNIEIMLRTGNITMSAQAHRNTPALATFADKLDLTTTEQEILITPALAMALPAKLASLQMAPAAIRFNMSLVDAFQQRIMMIEPETMRARSSRGGKLYSINEPISRPRVDLARCNFTVELVEVEDLPADVRNQPHVDKLVNRVPERAQYRITHDMRHDVLVATWDRHTTTYDVGVRLT